MQDNNIKGRIHSYHTLTAIDGPGLRFLLFMQGCRLRCRYCHNPDSWSFDAGTEYSAEEMLDIILQYAEYVKGGLTVSGGEPLLQQEFLTELLGLCRQYDMHTAIDTAGSVPLTEDSPILNVTDLFLLDIKHADPDKYHALTGADLQTTLDNARLFSRLGKWMWIRFVLVPDLTDGIDDMKRLREFIDTLSTVDKVIVQPYSALGIGKWDNLGIPYTLRDTQPPSKELIREAEEILIKK